MCLSDSEQTEKHKILLDFEFWVTKPGCPTSQQPYFTSDQIEYILRGNPDEGEVGLLALCRIKLGVFSFRKSKRSCEIALRIIHTMLFEPNFKLRQAVEEEFIGFESGVYMIMDLGKHY